MNMTLNKRWCLTAILALSAVVYTSSSYAATDRLVIESGDSAQSRQQASMEKSNGTTPQPAPEGEQTGGKRVG